MTYGDQEGRRSAKVGHPLPIWPALATTVALGVLLRWWMAGFAPGIGEFPPLRSAHTHLAFYGVLMPATWVAWVRAGWKGPSRTLLLLNSVATAVAVADFAVEGYAAVSIVGSTLVLGCWIASALPHRGQTGRASWLAPAFPCVIASAAAIPAVAILSSREHPAAADWVHAFLTWILLGLAAPAALAAAGAPAPGGLLHTASVLSAGLAFGPGQGSSAIALCIPEGLLLASAGWKLASPPLRWGWVVTGTALLAVGSGLVPWDNSLAVAGIHFVALGPVLGTLAWPSVLDRWKTAYLVLVAAFAGSIHLAGTSPASWGQAGVAIVGSLVAVAWITAGLAAIRAGRGLAFAAGKTTRN